MVSPRDLRIGLTWKFSSAKKDDKNIEVTLSSFKENYVWAQNSIPRQIIECEGAVRTLFQTCKSVYIQDHLQNNDSRMYNREIV